MSRWVHGVLVCVAAAALACNVPEEEPEPECGNGLVEAGELCDDANADDTDLCLSTCVLATCGDGVVFAALEECDEGAANSNDGACKSDCTNNVCGDGHQGPGEECDDGNAIETDACTSDCELAGCGDGFLQGSEECDDGDDEDGDGCSGSCLVELGWTCPPGQLCECAAGYAGSSCSDCAEGYQDTDGDGACLPTCDLFELTGDGCTDGVDHCEIVTGEATCVCDDGLYDLGSGCQELAACTVFVALDGTGDGSSWDQARPDLQGAIDAAEILAAGRPDGHCDVWVRAGTYPVYTSDPTDSLILKPGVGVYGGFTGSPAYLEGRVVDQATGLPVDETVLDGADSVLHVVTGADDARLDGFVIQGGRATGDYRTKEGWGAGLFADGVEGLQIARVAFRGNWGQRGGAAYVTGTSASFSWVTFDGNVAEWDGGALYAVDLGLLQITDGWFDDNANSNGHGGAIANRGVDVFELIGTTFRDNDTRWDGGAIWHVGGTTVTVVESQFVDNNQDNQQGCLGGAMYLRGFDLDDVEQGWATAAANLGSVSIVNTEFLGNHAMMEGGALYLRDVDSLDVVDGIFRANEAQNGFTEGGWPNPGGIGGAIVAYDLDYAGISCTSFVGNLAAWKGGAVALLGAGDVITTQASFLDNDAITGEGGGLTVTDATGDVVLDEAVFSDNTSYIHGAGASVDGFGSVSVKTATFQGNIMDGSWDMGGALFLRGDRDTSAASIDSTVFEGNFTRGVGSAVGADFVQSVSVTDSAVIDNGDGADDDSGGPAALYARFVGALSVADTDFQGNGDNRTWGPGAAYIANTESVDIQRSTFRDNEADPSSSQQGAIIVCNDASPTLTGGNQCWEPTYNFDSEPEGLAFETTLTVADSTFEDNDGATGASHLWTKFVDTVDVAGTRFADGGGFVSGAIWVEDGREVTVTGSDFVRNSGQYTGSAIVMKPSYSSDIVDSLTIGDSTFTEQTGAPPVRSEHIDTVEVTDSTFVGAGAETADCYGDWPDYYTQGWYMGGAAHIEDADSVLVEDTSFTDFQAQAAGALSVENGDGTDVTIRRTSFTNARSAVGGGALFLRSGDTAVLEDVSFAQTSSCYAGGALLVESFGEVTMDGATFEDYAGNIDAGAAHFTYNDKVTVRDAHFMGATEDTETLVAGALQIEYPKSLSAMSEVLLDGVEVHASRTQTTGGGAQIRQADSVTVTGSHFETNECEQADGGWCLGAGLFVSNVGDLLVEQTAFVDNDASGIGQVGAGLEADGVHALMVRDSIFTGNVVAATGPGEGQRGAGIDFRPSVYNSRVDPLSIDVQGSTFIDNHATYASAISIDRVYVGDVVSIDMDVVNSVIRDSEDHTVIENWSSYPFAQHADGLTIRYSDVQGKADAPNDVIDADPQFLTADVADPWRHLRPAPGSPLLNAGTFLPGSTDFEGTPRSNPPEIGAFEAP